MKTSEYMELAKKVSKIPSDYALAQRLEITRQAVSKFQSGNYVMSDEIAMKIAQLTGKNPVFVLADVHAEREKNPEIRAVWLGMIEKLSMGFNLLLLPAKKGLSV